MTTNELKLLLFNEHKKDLRLTIIRYSLILATIIAVVSLAYFFAFEASAQYLRGVMDFFDNAKNKQANTYKIIISLVFLSGIAYFIYDIFAVAKRKQKIEEFIAKIEAGKVASNIFDNRVYKIKIFLLKITLNLYPITYANVSFSDEMTVYKIPILPFALPDLKILLSGVKMQNVNKAWHELYDGETTETAEQSELKSQKEFNQFIDNELSSKLSQVEQNRSKGKRKYIVMFIVSLLVIGAWMSFQFGLMKGMARIDPQKILIGFIVVSVIYSLIMTMRYRKNAKKPTEESFDYQFKTKIFSKLINYINPQFRYVLHGHISLPEFLEMGFFENKHYDLSGNDQIIGKHSGVPFQLCDLSVSRERQFSSEDDSPDDVFSGQIFIAKFNKAFNSDVYLVPKKISSIFSRGDANLHFDYLGEKVQVDDAEFMKIFNVYATNPKEANFILNQATIKRIKELSLKNKNKLLISFRNNRISIANNSRKNNFEVSMFKSITANNQLNKFYDELCEQLRIIDDLKLNLNIWKKIL